MLNSATRNLIHLARTGISSPVSPKSLGLSRLPRSARLFIDEDANLALALCERKSRFAHREASVLLEAIQPLRQRGLQKIVVALSGGATVTSSAKTLFDQSGAELVLNFVQEEHQVDNILSDLPEQNFETQKATRSRVWRPFELCANHEPTGDQPNAIRFLTNGLRDGKMFQTMHGVTGSGKTFMMANIIAQSNLPTLILAPNKTLAAQIYNEMTRYFPRNRVEFFVSHFKYYQPEAYLPNSDKYISKASVVDDTIDRLRHQTTRSLFERNDTIAIASVSALYGLGLPTEYLEASICIRVGSVTDTAMWELAERLKELCYQEEEKKDRITRGYFSTFDTYIDVSPPWEPEGTVYRVSFLQEEISRIESIDLDSGVRFDLGEEVVLYPAKHFATPKERLMAAIEKIEDELRTCMQAFSSQGKMLEASRLEQRVKDDVEMMKKVGFCHGSENYTMYLSGRDINNPPETLLDYMPRDGNWLLFVDESHVTVPQLSAMHAGNAARKRKLIQYGFRLPSAMENRPLNSDEFWQKASQTIFVSATPGPFELEKSGPRGIVEAIIRPTGVLDPLIDVVKTTGQIEHLTLELAKVASTGGKSIVSTITKRFAEDLADCLAAKVPVAGVLDRPLRVAFLHSGIDSVGRMQVLEAMKDESKRALPSNGDDVEPLDVVVGVNLLREGIDLPAVQLVAILDADTEGFLRGETALIQTIGRAARNTKGRVIMYADTMTTAMTRAISETSRRRRLQMAFNSVHNIAPGEVGSTDPSEADHDEETLLDRIRKLKLQEGGKLHGKVFQSNASQWKQSEKLATSLLTVESDENVESLRDRMLRAAESQEFEVAAILRDQLVRLSETKRND